MSEDRLNSLEAVREIEAIIRRVDNDEDQLLTTAQFRSLITEDAGVSVNFDPDAPGSFNIVALTLHDSAGACNTGFSFDDALEHFLDLALEKEDAESRLDALASVLEAAAAKLRNEIKAFRQDAES